MWRGRLRRPQYVGPLAEQERVWLLTRRRWLPMQRKWAVAEKQLAMERKEAAKREKELVAAEKTTGHGAKIIEAELCGLHNVLNVNGYASSLLFRF
uniref:Uncharacterized protein n=1 Tax=Ditylenchus dipsaci TaxID=166011 RepID=A0A915DY26_9BILA